MDTDTANKYKSSGLKNSKLQQVKIIQDQTLGVNRKRICNFLIVINSNFGLSLPFSKYDVKSYRKWLVFLTTSLFDSPARGNLLEFLDETHPAKTRRMGLRNDENFMILTLTAFTDSPCDRRTDGRAIEAR